MTARSVRVGAVQMDCRVGQVEPNLEHATSLVEEAVRRGAHLVLLPELMPGGYQLTEEIWNSAEPFRGCTVGWLEALAQRLGIYVGTSFLEAAGADFYNTFVLATPSGEIVGRVRKSPPASLEAYFYRAGDDDHVIETALGRIGVGICYENLLYRHLHDLHRASVDLVLQPAAAGRPGPILPGDVARFDRTVKGIAPHYATVLGVPVVMADRAGPMRTKLPDGSELESSFPGFSMIVDSDGRVKAALEEEEGVLVEDVQLDPNRKKTRPPKCFGRGWAVPVPWYAFVWPLTQRMGERAYAANAARAQRARAITRRRCASP